MLFGCTFLVRKSKKVGIIISTVGRNLLYVERFYFVAITRSQLYYVRSK